MKRYIIKSQKGYENLMTRVEKGVKFLEDKWFDKEYDRAVVHYNAMASAIWNWEMDTGIFDEKYDAWCKNLDDVKYKDDRQTQKASRVFKHN